ncbi:MAG: hypothetical protein LQ346_009108, partial [Caloplaca aetnensis]
IMGYLNTTTNVTTPANASIYSDTALIPSPTPVDSPSSDSDSSSSSSGGAIPTADATGNQLLGSATPTATSGGSTGGGGTAGAAAASPTGDAPSAAAAVAALSGWGNLLVLVGLVMMGGLVLW